LITVFSISGGRKTGASAFHCLEAARQSVALLFFPAVVFFPDNLLPYLAVP
jgi:hypothetical protein